MYMYVRQRNYFMWLSMVNIYIACKEMTLP
uniref:Uncharacterized protein n=1 Tax=Amphimedon queenslandica TaxID=400682 RepID=A0A1X7UTA7_AMPQE